MTSSVGYAKSTRPRSHATISPVTSSRFVSFRISCRAAGYSLTVTSATPASRYRCPSCSNKTPPAASGSASPDAIRMGKSLRMRAICAGSASRGEERGDHVGRHVPAAPRVGHIGVYLCGVARQPFVAGAVLKACVERREPSGRIGGGVGHGGGEQVKGGGA